MHIDTAEKTCCEERATPYFCPIHDGLPSNLPEPQCMILRFRPSAETLSALEEFGVRVASPKIEIPEETLEQSRSDHAERSCAKTDARERSPIAVKIPSNARIVVKEKFAPQFGPFVFFSVAPRSLVETLEHDGWHIGGLHIDAKRRVFSFKMAKEIGEEIHPVVLRRIRWLTHLSWNRTTLAVYDHQEAQGKYFWMFTGTDNQGLGRRIFVRDRKIVIPSFG